MDEALTPQETKSTFGQPPKRRLTSLVGRLDVENYDQTITREEYYRSRATSRERHPSNFRPGGCGDSQRTENLVN
jgi:hypothetical protein